jgi:FAD/FMN-containing dehydrogenase
VSWVRENQLSFAVRCGGHSYEGFSQSADVVIDLRGLAAINVDTHANLVTVGSGASLYHIYQAVAAKGLALQAGSCPTVGVPATSSVAAMDCWRARMGSPATACNRSPWSMQSRASSQ